MVYNKPSLETEGETMKVEQILSMEGGTGVESYARNSSLQRAVILKLGPLLEEIIQAICSNTLPKCLTIADFGCSSGPNALSVLQSVIDTTILTCQNMGLRIPEFNAFMNDLPLNDFNTIFKLIPSFRKKIEEEKGVEISCCISGTPGSYYGKLFPNNSIHFMHSSYSLHFLSQVPSELARGRGEEALINKGYIYARTGCHPDVLRAYRRQFAKDFTGFLRCRSKEIIHGGRAILSFMGTKDDEACPAFELMGKSLNKMASEGLINRKKLEAFNMPHYRPTAEQVKQLVEAEGSFILHHLDTFTLPWYAAAGSEEDAPDQTASAATGTIRAVFQPLLAGEFGEEVVDVLFGSVEEMIGRHMAVGGFAGFVTHVVSLIKSG